MPFNRNGFTLIEVLVTLAISSMILLIGTISMKFMVTSLSKETSTLPTKAISFLQMRSLIAALSPYVIYSKKPFDPTHYNYEFFFYGDKTHLRFISESPLNSTVPSIIELSLAKNQLVYKESPLYDSMSNYLAPEISTNAYSFVLLNDLEDAIWEYETNKSTSSSSNGAIPQRIKFSFKQKNIQNDYIFQIQSTANRKIDIIRTRLEAI